MSRRTKYILSHFISGAVILFIFVIPILTQARSGGSTGSNSSSGATGGQSGAITIINPFKKDSIQGLIETIVNDIFLPIGGVVAVVMIIYAGFLYVTARGNPGKIEKAHQALLWAVIGAAILLGAWVISKAIGATIDQLKKG